MAGPDELAIEERPDPKPRPARFVIEVKAFGINHAEIHNARGPMAEIAEISGIECAGLVKADPSGRLSPGQKVVASWAAWAAASRKLRRITVSGEQRRADHDRSAVGTARRDSGILCDGMDLPHGNLALEAGSDDRRPRRDVGARQAASTLRPAPRPRHCDDAQRQARHGARGHRREEILIETPELSARLREAPSEGADAVLELVGNSTVLDSLKMVRRDGRLCEAGWLGGLAPIAEFNPIMQLPSGVHFSLFGSFVFGTPEFPVSQVPMQHVVDRVADGTYKAKPIRVFASKRSEKRTGS